MRAPGMRCREKKKGTGRKAVEGDAGWGVGRNVGAEDCEIRADEGERRARERERELRRNNRTSETMRLLCPGSSSLRGRDYQQLTFGFSARGRLCTAEHRGASVIVTAGLNRPRLAAEQFVFRGNIGERSAFTMCNCSPLVLSRLFRRPEFNWTVLCLTRAWPESR